MNTAPLIGHYQPDDVLAWEGASPITARKFLSDVRECADSLPSATAVLNMAQDRYGFLIGLAAAILRRQVTLLPQSTAAKTLADIAARWPDCYCLTDGLDTPASLPVFRIPRGTGSAPSRFMVPTIPLDQPVVVAFTSGTTGAPSANMKTWEALVNVARDTGARLGLNSANRPSIIATVPQQHMFGLEASIMLALQHGCAVYTGRPLFPADVRTALAQVPAPHILVTTPLHIKTLVAHHAAFPHIDRILSATAPLPKELACEAERAFTTQVHEIYGFAEAGSVAARRTTQEHVWRPLDGINMAQEDENWYVRASYLPKPVPVPDDISVHSDRTFTLHGRTTDQVNIAGHRASLSQLSQRLMQIAGVEDGVFFIPDEGGETMTTRLIAFAVAPGKTLEDIRTALRSLIDPVFLPRPVFLVERLPRNATGKLTREALVRLTDECRRNGHRGL
jgi:acyl-coenzyme A synthetase/AMP-(fatty) acid ligase